MELFIDALIVLLILTNLWLLGSSRLNACIRAVAFQGVLLGVLPLLVIEGDPGLRVAILSAVTVGLKGVVFPWLLLRALRSVNVRREMEPFVGYPTSILAEWDCWPWPSGMGGRLPLPVPAKSSLVVPPGPVHQHGRPVCRDQPPQGPDPDSGLSGDGKRHLRLRPGFAHQEPLLVELGTLLDVFMASSSWDHHIPLNREFDHIDTDLLSTLKD
jgi:hydrogenase-4 component E